MTILNLANLFALGRDEMARPEAINEPLVTDYVTRLVRAKIDRAEFNTVFEELKDDKQLRAMDVITIAQRYNRGGKRATSKKKAIEGISKRFVEIVRFHAKNKVAERVRPW
jgi:hypothetical protein